MAAKKPGTPATVTLKHLAANLSESHEMSKKQTEAGLGDLVGLVTKHLKKGDRIRIGGLGILQVRKRAARMGRNPATGEPIQIKASKKALFRAPKQRKESAGASDDDEVHLPEDGDPSSGILLACARARPRRYVWDGVLPPSSLGSAANLR